MNWKRPNPPFTVLYSTYLKFKQALLAWRWCSISKIPPKKLCIMSEITAKEPHRHPMNNLAMLMYHKYPEWHQLHFSRVSAMTRLIDRKCCSVWIVNFEGSLILLFGIKYDAGCDKLCVIIIGRWYVWCCAMKIMKTELRNLLKNKTKTLRICLDKIYLP